MKRVASTHDHIKKNSLETSTDEPARQVLPEVEFVTITVSEHIDLKHRAAFAESMHARIKEKLRKKEQEILLLKGKIKDLTKRIFGKSSEKSTTKSEKKSQQKGLIKTSCPRGQQLGSSGHGRTKRPDLAIVHEINDLPEDKKSCPNCGLPFHRNPALDEKSSVITVQVSAHERRIKRPAYNRDRGCQCEETPSVITAPPPVRLIPRSNYDVSIWVELMLKKYLYSQPINRTLQDFADQGLPVSAGTVAGGLQRIAPLFDPVLDALYCKQMSEGIFHNDETRWEVFEVIKDKATYRWYLWVTRSQSVIFYCIDPSRSAAVPGAHFAGIQQEKIIIVCDRYSAYKKLSRLSNGTILLAYCWAHVRRDFLNAEIAFKDLHEWSSLWVERIGTLYHHNKLRLEQWNPKLSIAKQSDTFHEHHNTLNVQLQIMYNEAEEFTKTDENTIYTAAQMQQRKVLESLLRHWSGLMLFVEHPKIPMDNNLAENAIRSPVTGRKNYYGSGSVWSAELAATLFTILQTLGLWKINRRHWMYNYLRACAENNGTPPEDITPWLPWQMSEERRAYLTKPPPYQDSS